MENNAHEVTHNAYFTHDNANEVIILQEKDTKKRGINVDISEMSLKALSEMSKEDLFLMCENKNLLKKFKKWEIERFTRMRMAKLLKEDSKKEEEQPEEEKKEEKQEEKIDLSKVDFSLFQKGILELSKGEEPQSFDLLASQVVENSETELITASSVEKFNKVIYYVALGHILIKNFLGGYKNARNIIKQAYRKARGYEEPTKREAKAKDEN